MFTSFGFLHRIRDSRHRSARRCSLFCAVPVRTAHPFCLAAVAEAISIVVTSLRMAVDILSSCLE